MIGTMKTYVYIDDQIINGEEATLSPLDLSVLRGFGVMDYLRTYQNRPFCLQEHIDRFFMSAQTLGLTVPKTKQEIGEIVYALIDRSGFEETSIKIALTGGISDSQLMPEGPSTFFAVAYPFTPFPQTYFDEGIKITTTCYQRPFPEVKSTTYLPAIMALKSGAVDVLFYNEKNHLLETGTANFFAIQNGEIITPKEGILKGVTRKVVLELTGAKERIINREEIPTFEGAFLTSSNKEVMPIIQIDDHIINEGKKSASIISLMQQFKRHVDLFSKKSLQIN